MYVKRQYMAVSILIYVRLVFASWLKVTDSLEQCSSVCRASKRCSVIPCSTPEQGNFSSANFER